MTLKAEGGMGKTRLAIQCAAQVADLFPDGVYFVPLTTTLPSEEAVAEAIGRAIGLPPQEWQPTKVLDELKGRTTLLVLDNYESVEDPARDPDNKVGRYLIRLVTEAHGLRLLVTGRSAVKISGMPQIIGDLENGMTPAEARDLFLDRARLRWGLDRQPTIAEEPQLTRILDLTARIPLAIELAAAWVGYCELKEIADGLEATPLGEETGLPPRHLRPDADTAYGRHDSLTRSLDWSYNLLGTTGGQAAQAIFATCGLFAHSFDEPTVAKVAGVAKAGAELRRLLDTSLIRREPDDGSTRYRLHRFTRDYALHRLDEAPHADVARRFVAHYVRLALENSTNSNDVARYAVLDKEWRNALAAFRIAVEVRDTFSFLSMATLMHFFQFRSLWSEAEFLNIQILASIQSTNEKKNEDVTLNNIGIVYQAQGRYDEALEAYTKALEICRKFKHLDGEGSTLSNMGNLHRVQGHYDEALEAYTKALKIKRKSKDLASEGHTLNNMGDLHQTQGRYDEALETYSEALEIRREFKDRIGEGWTLNNMGVLYQTQGRYDEAFKKYTEALEIRRKFKDRAGECGTINNMGNLYQIQGRYDEALKKYTEALEICGELKNRVFQGDTLNNIGLLHQIQGRYDEALETYTESFEICRELKDRVGQGHTLHNIGIVYQAQGRYDEAFKKYTEALEICLEFKDRVGQGNIHNSMGFMYQVQDQYIKAFETYAEALEIRREFKDRVGQGKTLNNMGFLYQVQGYYAEALETYVEALEIRREFKDRVGQGQTLMNLATLSEARGKLPEAIEWARQGVAVLETTEAKAALENARHILNRLEKGL